MSADTFVDERAERAVLGWLQLAPADCDDIAELVDGEDFADPRHATAFGALVEVIRATGGVDFASITDALRRRHALGAVGVQYIASCTDEAGDAGAFGPTRTGAIACARRIADLAQRRRLVVAAREALALASTEPTADDAIAAALARVEAVARARHVSTARSFSAALSSLLNRDRSQAQGWALPWPALSAALGGLRPGRLVVIAGRPGKGKSAMKLNTALSLAAPKAWDARSLAAPVPVLVFTLEMVDEELAGRGAGVLARVDARAVEAGRLVSDDVTAVIGAITATASAPLMIDDKTTRVTRMRTLAQSFFRRHGPGVMFVDYLQLCDARGLDLERDATRERRVAEMSRAFKIGRAHV